MRGSVIITVMNRSGGGGVLEADENKTGVWKQQATVSYSYSISF
jgi:hypothetical protein